MEYQSAEMNEYSPGTFECDDMPGCLYHTNGRCVFNISKIRQRTSRACYEQLRLAEIEDETDYISQLISG